MPSVDAFRQNGHVVDGATRRENLYRIVRANEDHLLTLVQPTATTRLILDRRGVRAYLPSHVLQADRRATTVLSERLTAVETFRSDNDITTLTYDELKRYNRNVVRTINLFLVYREFQLWQGTHLPSDEDAA